MDEGEQKGADLLKRLIIILIAVFSLTGFVQAAETDWSVHIKVSVPDSRGADGTVWNHLIAGVREGAGDGFDSAWDTLALVEADDPVQAMFSHGAAPVDKDNDGVIDSWICNELDPGYTNNQCSLWRDIRTFGAEKTWSFQVLSPVNGGTITLQWSFSDMPGAMEITLVDLSDKNNVMDMPGRSSYSYTNNFEPGKKYGIHYLEVRTRAKGFFIIPSSVPDATVGAPYSEKLSAVGGSPVWSLEDGALPAGVSLNIYTGEITGTPAVTGTFRFAVRIDDPATGQKSSREYNLNVNAKPVIDAAKLPDGVAGTTYTGQMTATGGSGLMTWDIEGNLPEGVSLDSRTGIISGTLIVPGIYDFKTVVRDANGATDSKDLRVVVIEPEDKLAPAAVTDLSGMYATDTSVLLKWSSPSDDSMTQSAAFYDLRYLEDCPGNFELNDSTWGNATEASGVPRPQAGVLQTYTLTGSETGKSYCIAIKSMDASGHVSAISNIVILPLTSDMHISGLSRLASPVKLSKRYNLISVPLIPVPGDRESLFGPVVGSPVALYRWYSAYPGITPPQYYLEDHVEPGFAYLLYSPSDDITLTIDGLSIEEPEYSVMLQGGWNMIGTPYSKMVLLRDILVKNNMTGESRPFTDAVKTGSIGNAIYQLKSGNYDFFSFNDDPPAAFEPWTGYWIYVGDENGAEIIFRRPN